MAYEIQLDNLRMTDLASDSTFNTQVIVDAISALDSKGGKLIAPGGKCHYDPMPEIKRPFILEGKGGFEGGGTVWKSQANALLFPIGFDDYGNACRSIIRNMSFIGSYAPGPNGENNKPNQTLFQVRTRVFMDNVHISYMGKNGILWKRGTGSVMRNVEIENCGNSGEVENEENPGYLTTIRRINCTVANCQGHGREVTATGGCSYGIGNLITGCSGYALVMENVDRYIERGLYCEGNAGDAYLTANARNCHLHFMSMQGAFQNYGGATNFIGYEAP